MFFCFVVLDHCGDIVLWFCVEFLFKIKFRGQENQIFKEGQIILVSFLVCICCKYPNVVFGKCAVLSLLYGSYVMVILGESSPPPCVTCHVSHAKYHMSHVMCPFILFFFFPSRQNGWASWWRACNQQGLPRLVIYVNYKFDTIHSAILKDLIDTTEQSI